MLNRHLNVSVTIEKAFLRLIKLQILLEGKQTKDTQCAKKLLECNNKTLKRNTFFYNVKQPAAFPCKFSSILYSKFDIFLFTFVVQFDKFNKKLFHIFIICQHRYCRHTNVFWLQNQVSFLIFFVVAV